jgi:hypothetical protein
LAHSFGPKRLLVPKAPGPVSREVSVNTPVAVVHPAACLNCLCNSKETQSGPETPRKPGERDDTTKPQGGERQEKDSPALPTCISMRAMTSSGVATAAVSSNSPTSLGSPLPCSLLTKAWMFAAAPRRVISFAQANRCSARTTAPRTSCTRSANADTSPSDTRTVEGHFQSGNRHRTASHAPALCAMSCIVL